MTLRPSDAHLWVRCPLAGQMLASGEYYSTPDPEIARDDYSDARREGTCAHWAADLVFTGQAETASELIGESHNNGWVIDDEMAGYVDDYVSYVRSFGPATASEIPVRLFDLISGRLDTVSSGSAEIIRIFDFKYGWRQIEAEENYAMLCYGLSVAAGRRITVELHIFQPRGNHPDGHARVWTIKPEFVGVWYDWLERAARACFDIPQGKPGKQCLDCPANGSCHALTANVFAQYETITDDRMSDHSPAELGAYLTFLRSARDLVNAKLSGIEAETMARLNRGQIIPKWGTEPRIGNRKFTVDRERVRLATGIDPVKEVPMSPVELERAGVPKHVVKLITDRPTIGRKLTNNPEAAAARMFGPPVTSEGN